MGYADSSAGCGGFSVTFKTGATCTSPQCLQKFRASTALPTPRRPSELSFTQAPPDPIASSMSKQVSGRAGAFDVSEDTAAPPPAYSEASTIQQPPPALESAADTGHGGVTAGLSAAFDNLALPDEPSNPTVDTCLAHLKLLFAFQWMKEDVGLTDGLWGLWDARAGPANRPPEKEKDAPESTVQERIKDQTLQALSNIREKRWALFVARAVDRYEAWWKSLPGRPLSERDMDELGSVAYANFPTSLNRPMEWTEDMLPPLGMSDSADSLCLPV